MKKCTLFASALFLTLGANAQIFSDNFDTYTTGAVGPQSTTWTTWSGTEGGGEDGIVSTAQFNSAPNSLQLIGGGTQDVVLDFGTQYSTGIFTFQCDMFVPTGANGYFNIQETLSPIGTNWTNDFFFDAGGAFHVDDTPTATVYASGAYPVNTWFTFKVVAGLNANNWEVFIDGTSLGTWANLTNILEGIDFYPTDGASEFYIDNLSFDHTDGASVNELIGGVSNFQVYPNPASSVATVSFNVDQASEVAVRLIDLNGKVLVSNKLEASNGTSSVELNTSNIQAGIYNVELTINGERSVKRLVIQ